MDWLRRRRNSKKGSARSNRKPAPVSSFWRPQQPQPEQTEDGRGESDASGRPQLPPFQESQFSDLKDLRETLNRAKQAKVDLSSPRVAADALERISELTSILNRTGSLPTRQDSSPRPQRYTVGISPESSFAEPPPPPPAEDEDEAEAGSGTDSYNPSLLDSIVDLEDADTSAEATPVMRSRRRRSDIVVPATQKPLPVSNIPRLSLTLGKGMEKEKGKERRGSRLALLPNRPRLLSLTSESATDHFNSASASGSALDDDDDGGDSDGEVGGRHAPPTTPHGKLSVRGRGRGKANGRARSRSRPKTTSKAKPKSRARAKPSGRAASGGVLNRRRDRASAAAQRHKERQLAARKGRPVHSRRQEGRPRRTDSTSSGTTTEASSSMSSTATSAFSKRSSVTATASQVALSHTGTMATAFSVEALRRRRYNELAQSKDLAHLSREDVLKELQQALLENVLLQHKVRQLQADMDEDAAIEAHDVVVLTLRKSLEAAEDKMKALESRHEYALHEKEEEIVVYEYRLVELEMQYEERLAALLTEHEAALEQLHVLNNPGGAAPPPQSSSPGPASEDKIRSLKQRMSSLRRPLEIMSEKKDSLRGRKHKDMWRYAITQTVGSLRKKEAVEQRRATVRRRKSLSRSSRADQALQPEGGAAADVGSGEGVLTDAFYAASPPPLPEWDSPRPDSPSTFSAVHSRAHSLYAY